MNSTGLKEGNKILGRENNKNEGPDEQESMGYSLQCENYWGQECSVPKSEVGKKVAREKSVGVI